MTIGIKGQLRDQEIEILRTRLSEALEHLAKAQERGETDLVKYDAAVHTIDAQIRALSDARVG